MYFKRLELYGFKSFADKTVIDLNDGITCIVGPNGSGKSNFSDAIKWVLGEQRAGELRGKSMSDVIFAGTERRGSMSYCEVSLVFDNSTRTLFPDVPYDEVVISRKLYRNGESEYLLNRSAAKLKTIRELIADTGLGKGGFSIIGQGQVAKIIASKPEDRRSIFEEAAGISKYKKSRDDAERELLKTREHLARYSDIVHEIERNLPKLEKQSNDAKLFIEYRDELKKLEINHYLYLTKNNVDVKASINEKIKGISEEIEQIERDIESLDREYFNTTVEIRKNDDTISEIRDKRTEFMLEKERVQGRSNVLSERLDAINRDIEKTENDVKRLDNQLRDKLEEAELTASRIADINAETDKKRQEYDDVETRHLAVVDDIIKREKDLEATSKSLLEGMAKLGDINADKSKLTADRDYAKERIAESDFYIEKAKKDIEEAENLKQELNAVLTAAKSGRDKAYNARVACRNRLNELKFEEQQNNRELQELNSGLISLKTKKELITRMKNEYDSYNNAVKKLMEECKTDRYLKTKVLGVVAELLKVDERYETAIEVALGANLQHIASPTEDDVKYIIEVLKKKRFGRLTVLPVNVMRPRSIVAANPVFKENGCIGSADKLIRFEPAYSNLFSNLLGATLVFDDYDNAISVAKKYNRQYRIVTLDGELISPGGAITGGSRRSEGSGILSQERELEKVTAYIDMYSKEQETRSMLADTIKSEYDSKIALLSELDEELKSLDIEYATATERDDQAESNLDKLLSLMTEYVEKRNEYHAKLNVIEATLSHTERLSDDITGNQISVDDDNSKSRLEFEMRKQEKDRLLDIKERLRLEIAQHELTLDNCKDNSERIAEEIADIEKALRIDKENIAALEENARLVKTSLLKSGLTDKDKSKLEKFETDLQEKEELKKILTARLTEISSAKDVKNRSNLVARENKVKQEGILDRIDAQMFAMTERLKEEYDVDYEKALLFKDEDFDDTNAAQEIANTKRKITNLGSVNPGAIEEYREVSERYKDMSEQLNDTLTAETRLLELIKELSDEILSIFNTQFMQIAANFRITFKEIFGGGKGELMIDPDAEDPLTAGIEIMAQPPGKTSKSLTLLSGGEMALTAIAILFAILKNKAMPFCILDEIEAALDETNARLFAKYLKRFVDETQFIVITHRKPTMEQADRLYGVTMEEKGVSKIVSVELNEAVKSVAKDKTGA